MAHNNGRIFIDTSTTPNKGVEIADLQQVLGRGTGDLGLLCSDQEWYDTGVLDEQGNPIYALRPVNRINMWARYKPIKWSTSNAPVFFPQGTHPSDWNKGLDGDYGIVSNSFSQVSSLYAAIDGSLNGWSYVKDGITYRLRDFEGYYHYAPNPFKYLFIQADRLSVAPSGTITIQYQLRQGGGSTTDPDSLGINDLYVYTPSYGGKRTISSMYLAIVVYKESNGSYIYEDWVSASETLADLEEDLAMHTFTYTASSEAGNYRFIPVLTTSMKELSAQAIGDIATIPETNFVDFVVSTRVVPRMVVDAFVYNTGTYENPNYNNKVYFICYFYGGSEDPGNFNNISISFVYRDVGLKTIDNVQNGETAGQLVVPAGSSTKLPAGSGDYYSIVWDSGAMTLENLIRGGGMVRIYDNRAGSSIQPYEQPLREAAALPGGSEIPF